jgi:hypothetical protein
VGGKIYVLGPQKSDVHIFFPFNLLPPSMKDDIKPESFDYSVKTSLGKKTKKQCV